MISSQHHFFKSGSRAFTLLEILLVIALIALLSTLAVISVNTLLKSADDSPNKRFWQAVNTARRTALQKHETVLLSFNTEANAFQVASSTNVKPTILGPIAQATRAEFLSATDDAAILIAGQAVSTATIPYVKFYSDGTCSPFRLQFLNDMGVSTVIEIDPWTCSIPLKEDNQ